MFGKEVVSKTYQLLSQNVRAWTRYLATPAKPRARYLATQAKLVTLLLCTCAVQKFLPLSGL